jgi:hypothetical protein
MYPFRAIKSLILLISVLTVKYGEANVVIHGKINSRISLPNVQKLDDDGRIILGWEVSSNSEEITFEIEAKTTGYVGFGVSPQGSMLDADIFIAGVDNNGVPYHSVNTVNYILN